MAVLHDLNIVHGQIKLEHIFVADDADAQSLSYSSYFEPVAGGDSACFKFRLRLPSNVYVRLCGFGEADFVAQNTRPYFDGPLSQILQNNSSAPETIASRERGFPADIWGLGCALVEMFTGEARTFGEVSATPRLAMMEKLCGSALGIDQLKSTHPDASLEEVAEMDTLEVSASPSQRASCFTAVLV